VAKGERGLSEYSSVQGLIQRSREGENMFAWWCANTVMSTKTNIFFKINVNTPTLFGKSAGFSDCTHGCKY